MKIGELEKALSGLKKEKAKLEAEIELRIQKLVRTDSEKLRKMIEESITSLEERKREVAERTAFVNHQISELQGLVSDDGGLYQDYRSRIREVLNGPADKRKTGLQDLILELVTE